MKVSSTGGVGATGPSRAKSSGGASGFSLPSVNAASGAASTASVGGLSGVGSVDALLALQAAGAVDGGVDGVVLKLRRNEGAPKRAFQRVSIWAQSTAIARAMASICNDERRALGRPSGCGGFRSQLLSPPAGASTSPNADAPAA